MPVLRLLALVFGVVALAFAAAGCGGGGDSSSSGTDPKTWASEVCGALQTWTDEIKAGSQSLSSDLRSSSDLKSVKQKVVSFLDDVKESTDKMVDDVKAAGSPDVDNGETIQGQFEQALTDVRDNFQEDLTKAKNLDTSDPQAFVSGVSNLAQQIQTQGQNANQRFNQIEDDSKELKDAIADEPSCQSLGGSS